MDIDKDALADAAEEAIELPTGAATALLVGLTYARTIASAKYGEMEAAPQPLLDFLEDAIAGAESYVNTVHDALGIDV